MSSRSEYHDQHDPSRRPRHGRRTIGRPHNSRTSIGHTGAPPTRARRGDGHLLRDDLINAGCQVLAECGDSQRLSLRAVAAANVTPAAVYRHVPDRRALVAAIAASCFADFADTLNTAAVGASDPFEGLRRRC